MNELTTITTLDEAREKLGRLHWEIAEDFIKIGYIFRQVEDQKLYVGQYESMADFAKKEYNYSVSSLSRLKELNETYSLDGYSETIDPKWKGFKQTQLIEMLNLSETVREEITPDIKRDELRQLNKDIDNANEKAHEEKFTAAIEGRERGSFLHESLSDYLIDHRDDLVPLWQIMHKDGEQADIDIRVAFSTAKMFTSGSATFFIRQDALKAIEDDEEETYTWSEVLEEFRASYESYETIDQWYERLTGEPYEDESKEEPKTTPEKPAVHSKKGASRDFDSKNEKKEVKSGENNESSNVREDFEEPKTEVTKSDVETEPVPAAESDNPLPEVLPKDNKEVAEAKDVKKADTLDALFEEVYAEYDSYTKRVYIMKSSDPDGDPLATFLIEDFEDWLKEVTK